MAHFTAGTGVAHIVVATKDYEDDIAVGAAQFAFRLDRYEQLAALQSSFTMKSVLARFVTVDGTTKRIFGNVVAWGVLSEDMLGKTVVMEVDHLMFSC